MERHPLRTIKEDARRRLSHHRGLYSALRGDRCGCERRQRPRGAYARDIFLLLLLPFVQLRLLVKAITGREVYHFLLLLRLREFVLLALFGLLRLLFGLPLLLLPRRLLRLQVLLLL
jgi:hypothetical protein